MNVLKDLTNQINHQLDLVESLRSQCEKTTPNMTENEAQNNSMSKKDDCYVRLMDESEKLTKLMDERNELICRPAFADPRIYAILEKRYRYGLTWNEIAEDLGLTKQRIYQMHREAIKTLDYS